MSAALRSAALGAGLFLALAAPCRGEEAARGTGDGAVKAEPEKATVSKKEKNLKMGEVTIQGEQERPKAMFILPKAAVETADEEDDRSFGPDVARPMNRRAMEGYSIVTAPAEGR